jgi:hypothetical protein
MMIENGAVLLNPELVVKLSDGSVLTTSPTCVIAARGLNHKPG